MTNDGLTIIRVKSLLCMGGPKEWTIEKKTRLCFGLHAVNRTERRDAIKNQVFHDWPGYANVRSLMGKHRGKWLRPNIYCGRHDLEKQCQVIQSKQ